MQSGKHDYRASYSYRQRHLIFGCLLRFLGLGSSGNNGSMVDSNDLFRYVEADLGTGRGAAEYLSRIAILCCLFDDHDTANGALGFLLDSELLVELVGRVAKEGIGEILLDLESLVRGWSIAGQSVNGVTSLREGTEIVSEETRLGRATLC